MWYNISVKRRGAVRQTLNSGIPVGVTADRPHLDRLDNLEVVKRVEPLRTRTAWGVAAGILSIEGCGEAGNP